jgi:hypothetical protein
MRLFTNACRLVLLLKHLPRKDVVQVYTIACHELIGRDPPGRRALCSFLAACDAPVALLQHRFLCVSQRVCQVRGGAAGVWGEQLREASEPPLRAALAAARLLCQLGDVALLPPKCMS